MIRKKPTGSVSIWPQTLQRAIFVIFIRFRFSTKNFKCLSNLLALILPTSHRSDLKMKFAVLVVCFAGLLSTCQSAEEEESLSLFDQINSSPVLRKCFCLWCLINIVFRNFLSYSVVQSNLSIDAPFETANFPIRWKFWKLVYQSVMIVIASELPTPMAAIISNWRSIKNSFLHFCFKFCILVLISWCQAFRFTFGSRHCLSNRKKCATCRSHFWMRVERWIESLIIQ